MSERDDRQGPPEKQTLQIDRDSVLVAIAELEREIPALVESEKRALLGAGEEYAPIESFARLSLRLIVLEARMALVEGRLHDALRIIVNGRAAGV